MLLVLRVVRPTILSGLIEDMCEKFSHTLLVSASLKIHIVYLTLLLSISNESLE